VKKFAFINEAAQRAFMALPKALRLQFGADLYAVQNGQLPYSATEDISDSVGKGAFELKENGSPAYRTVYCAKYMDTVYVLHAFAKTTQAVDRKNMSTAEGRYKELTALDRAQKRANKQSKRGGK
jgi:phage-related protein